MPKVGTYASGCVIQHGQRHIEMSPTVGYTRGQDLNQSPADLLSAPQKSDTDITGMAEDVAGQFPNDIST